MKVIISVKCARSPGIHGNLQWSPRNRVALATREGTVIFSLKSRDSGCKSVNAKLHTTSIPPVCLKSEPEIERVSLLSTMKDSDAVHAILLDCVISPSVRGSDNLLLTRRVKWSESLLHSTPGACSGKVGGDCLLASLAQQFLIYQWTGTAYVVAVNVSEYLLSYLDTQYEVKSAAEGYKTNKSDYLVWRTRSSHVLDFAWCYLSTEQSGNDHNIILVNSLNSFYNCQLSLSSQGLTCSVYNVEYCAPCHVTSLEWLACKEEGGTLLIGLMNGELHIVRVHFDQLGKGTSCSIAEKLGLMQDYRAVQCIRVNRHNRTFTFLKHDIAFVASQKGVLHQVLVTDSKFTLNDVVCDERYFYVCTADAGVIVKSRYTGDTVGTHCIGMFCEGSAVVLSPSGIFLMAVCSIPINDLYQSPDSIDVSLISLQPLSDSLMKEWNSLKVHWDSLLQLSLECPNFPVWFLDICRDTLHWPSLSIAQCQRVRFGLVCLEFAAKELGFPSSHLMELHVTRRHLISVKEQLVVESFDDLNALIDTCSKYEEDSIRSALCPVCGVVVNVTREPTCVCHGGHALSVCSQTLGLVGGGDPSSRICIQCGAVAGSVQTDDPSWVQLAYSNCCVYCDGDMELNWSQNCL